MERVKLEIFESDFDLPIDRLEPVETISSPVNGLVHLMDIGVAVTTDMTVIFESLGKHPSS